MRSVIALRATTEAITHANTVATNNNFAMVRLKLHDSLLAVAGLQIIICICGTAKFVLTVNLMGGVTVPNCQLGFVMVAV